MVKLVLGMLGAFAPLVAVLYIVGLAFVCLAFPFMVISVVRNLTRIRRALERIADSADSGVRTVPGSILHT